MTTLQRVLDSGYTARAGKVLVLLLVVVAMAGVVSATRVSAERDVVKLGNPTEMIVHLNYSELTSSRVSTVVPGSHEPENIRGVDSQGEIDCQYRTTFGSEIVCEPNPGAKKGNYSVTIRYTTPNPSLAEGDYEVLNYLHRILVPTEQYTLEVILPEGYGIVDTEDVRSIVPPNGETGSEGRRIFVTWTRTDMSLGDTLNFQVRYQELNVFENVFPDNIATVIALGAIFLAIIVSFFLKRRKGQDTIAAVFPVLKTDEKEVLKFIIEEGEECEQRDLVDNLDYSKAKISRLVKDLEERHLIEKIKEGRKNRLTLQKEVGDVDFSSE